MTIEILVPDFPESVADATVATWHKKVGETVKRDEVLVEIETCLLYTSINFIIHSEFFDLFILQGFKD